MANAARVHAVERGKELQNRTMIAFGGAAPLHAARLAEKLDVRTIVIPSGAGVGSAVGFLLAPVAYEVVRTPLFAARRAGSRLVRSASFAEMRAEAEAVVGQGRAERRVDGVLDGRHALSRPGSRDRRDLSRAKRPSRQQA